jgi:hypothetical protein
MMEAIGLMPSSTGALGGKRTGDRVSHWIVPGGPFDLACQAFLAEQEGLLWGDRTSSRRPAAKGPSSSARSTASPRGLGLASGCSVASTRRAYDAPDRATPA